jgi:signal transduction histidine kinase
MPELQLSGEEARERLLEAARLANVGRIVPSLAHEMSTPLAAIGLRAESLEGALADPQRPAPAEKLTRYLRVIGEETQRCKLLLSTLQEFARRPEATPGPIDLAPLSRAAVRLVHHEAMRRQVELKLELQEPLPAISGNSVRVAHALVSLLLNAIDASPSGAAVVLAAAADASGVVFSVADEGAGLAEEARARLFEPLASTHPPDRAAGLGLMACRAIAEAQGGSIAFAPGGARGCRVELRLPSRQKLPGSDHAQSA